MTNQAGTGSCSYCSAPITWVEPLALWKSDPDAFSDVLSRAGLEYRQVESVWFCTECTNFALIGDGFEVQYLDGAYDVVQCKYCGEVSVQFVDPAQAILKDREGYLAMKKQVGPQAVLDGEASVCGACGVVIFLPDLKD